MLPVRGLALAIPPMLRLRALGRTDSLGASLLGRDLGRIVLLGATVG